MERIRNAIRRTLLPEDLGPIERMSELILPCIVLCEFGYVCRAELRADARAYVLAALVPASVRSGAPVATFDVSRFRAFLMEDEDAPTDDDLLDAYFVVRNLIQAPDSPLPEALAKWLGEGWDGGVKQRRVYDMEIEGGISPQDAIIGNLACSLHIFGQRQGLMPASSST